MWPVALSGRLPVEALVGRRPANKLIGRDPIPFRKSLPDPPCEGAEHPALPPVSRSYSGEWGRLVTHYSPVRHSHPQASLQDPVRLACVKHAASVRPEPESNPPRKNHGRAERLQNKETTKKPNPMQDTGKGHRTKTGTGSSPPAPTHKRRRPRPTGNQMTCKVAQNTLLSSQTTTTHEAGQPDPAGRRPSKQQEKNIHHPPQKHKPPTNPHPKNPTNKPPPTACRTHPHNNPHNNTNTTTNTPPTHQKHPNKHKTRVSPTRPTPCTPLICMHGKNAAMPSLGSHATGFHAKASSLCLATSLRSAPSRRKHRMRSAPPSAEPITPHACLDHRSCSQDREPSSHSADARDRPPPWPAHV